MKAQAGGCWNWGDKGENNPRCAGGGGFGGKQDSNQVETDVPVSGFYQTFHIQSVRGFLVEPSSHQMGKTC